MVQWGLFGVHGCPGIPDRPLWLGSDKDIEDATYLWDCSRMGQKCPS